MVPYRGPAVVGPTVQEVPMDRSHADDAEPLRSRDEDAIGWGDDRDDAWSGSGRGADPQADPDVARLLADRPPHHDRY
jgi:hypothetical protein